MKNSTHEKKKKWEPNWFAHLKSVLTGVSSPVLD
jgi:hypothetical protein